LRIRPKSVPQYVYYRPIAGVISPKSSMLGKVLLQRLLKGHAALLRKSPAQSLAEQVRQSRPLFALSPESVSSLRSRQIRLRSSGQP
jgi:hypothetical protein